MGSHVQCAEVPNWRWVKLPNSKDGNNGMLEEWKDKDTKECKSKRGKVAEVPPAGLAWAVLATISRLYKKSQKL